MIKVVIQDVPAIINEQRWVSTDKTLEQLLNSMIDPDGPSGADPYPDMTIARAAIEQLGGHVVEADPPDNPPKGAVS